MIFNFFNKRRAQLEESSRLCVLANLAILQGNQDYSFELYNQAILECPENPGPYWPVIARLHEKKKDEEAYDLFQKVMALDNQIILEFRNDPKLSWFNQSGAIPSLTILMPAVIGMLTTLGKDDEARNMLIRQLQNLQNGDRKFDRGSFKDMFATEILTLSFSNGKKLLSLLTEIALDGYMPVEEWQSYSDACVEMIVLKAKFLLREGELSEALACIDFALGAEVKNFSFISISQISELQRAIRQEIEESEKWSSIKSDDEFLHYLFKRLAFRFHPDLATDEKDRVEKTKVMQEINRANEEKDLTKLEEIVHKYVPKWSKYMRTKKRN